MPMISAQGGRSTVARRPAKEINLSNLDGMTPVKSPTGCMNEERQENRSYDTRSTALACEGSEANEQISRDSDFFTKFNYI